MKILITGGSGDLGQVLFPALLNKGHEPNNFDIQPPQSNLQLHFQGSLLIPGEIEKALAGVDLIIHIAAWHGIHEARGWKTAQNFWDLNVNGLHNLLQASLKHDIKKLIHISSSSVLKLSGYYGFTKRLAEQAVSHFQHAHDLQTITLRPRAFIPFGNKRIYASYGDWARRFWPGAVHIHDVAQAVLLGVEKLKQDEDMCESTFNIDREAGFPSEVLATWDEEGVGTSFRKVYPQFADLAQRCGLDSSKKPNTLEFIDAKEHLGYSPQYGLSEFFVELSEMEQAGKL